MKIVIQFERKELINNLQYPVMVEMWNRRLDGSTRRKYHAEFTEKERKVIGKYHTLFYHWHCRVGTPDYCVMSAKTWDLLNRAVSFFARL